ncbi:MAG: glycerophosphodiester phosphodiesterase family protein [Deltaproteobacteria bacterium]|nr:glycerophosphodiester phosphodiesterase family protein [Deltaproteobacteria bacterium]
MIRGLCAGSLVFAVACGSSSAPAPIDPLATAYCAACSELFTCERVTSEALTVICPDETHAWYACVTDNACDDTACDTEWATRDLCMGRAPRDKVRLRIFSVRIGDGRPSANIGYRGTGPTREGHPFPENSLSSFLAAMDEGADGVELDAAVTQDGQIIVMHDDTLDRTTDNCTGCVSAMTFDEIRACRLLDGAGSRTEERPPTLLEVYSAIGGNALINVELNVFEPPCLTGTTGVEQLVPAVLEEVTRIGGQDRTIFSSLDPAAAALVKTERPGYYSAIVSDDTGAAEVAQGLALNQDAIHPGPSVSAETVQSALDEGLQVNVLLMNTADLTDNQIERLMEEQIEKGSTAIITDEPAILANLPAP